MSDKNELDGIALGDFMVKGGVTFRVIGIQEMPTLILQNEANGEQHSIAPSAPIRLSYTHYKKQKGAFGD